MKITKSQLKQIIREELEAALDEDKRGSDAVATYSGDRPEGWENCGPKNDSHEWRSCNQRNHNRNRVTEQVRSENDWNLLRITYQVCRRKKNPRENQSIARRMVAKHIAQAKRQNNWQGLVNHIKKKFCSDIEAVMAQQKKKHNLG